MRYYSTQRPIGPGTYPKPQDNAALEIHNYDSKTYCEEIYREAWGYIEYAQPIDPESAYDYELIPPISKIKAVRPLGRDGWGREVFEDESGKVWKYTEPGEMPRERHDRLFSSTNNSYDGEPCWPMKADIDYRIKEETEHE